MFYTEWLICQVKTFYERTNNSGWKSVSPLHKKQTDSLSIKAPSSHSQALNKFILHFISYQEKTQIQHVQQWLSELPEFNNLFEP